MKRTSATKEEEADEGEACSGSWHDLRRRPQQESTQTDFMGKNSTSAEEPWVPRKRARIVVADLMPVTDGVEWRNGTAGVHPDADGQGHTLIIDALPDEMVCAVFGHLPPLRTLHAAAVCRRWRDLVLYTMRSRWSVAALHQVLARAAELGYVECARMVLDASLMMTTKKETGFSWSGSTEFATLAAKNDKEEVLGLLLDHGAPVCQAAYTEAAERGHLSVIRMLATRPKHTSRTVHPHERYWDNACCVAARNNRIKVLKFLCSELGAWSDGAIEDTLPWRLYWHDEDLDVVDHDPRTTKPKKWKCFVYLSTHSRTERLRCSSLRFSDEMTKVLMKASDEVFNKLARRGFSFTLKDTSEALQLQLWSQLTIMIVRGNAPCSLETQRAVCAHWAGQGELGLLQYLLEVRGFVWDGWPSHDLIKWRASPAQPMASGL